MAGTVVGVAMSFLRRQTAQYPPLVRSSSQRAQSGVPERSCYAGASTPIIYLVVGTRVSDADTDEQLVDLVDMGQQLAAKVPWWKNTSFKSSTNRARGNLFRWTE